MIRKILKLVYLFAVVTLWLGLAVAAPTAKEKSVGGVSKVSKAQLAFIKVVDSRYQKEHGIAIKLKKKLFNKLLDRESETEGQAWFNQGLMRIEFAEPRRIMMLADQDYFWIEEHPPKDSKGGQVNVVKATLDSERARSQGLIQILTGGKMLQYFKVVGIKTDNKKKLEFFLQPQRTSAEFQRAMISIAKGEKIITELRYWDALDNETHYTFETTKFKQVIDQKLFDYQIPKGANVTTF